jgi:cytochrome c-type biogenesis protein CcmH/NrfG
MRGITLLKKVTEKDPANFEAQFNLGLFSMQSGQYDKAVGRFRTAIQLRGDLPELRLYLSDALSGAGMQQEARKELLDLKKLTRDSILQSEADRRLQQLKNSF